METSCDCGGPKTFIFACSGGSNVGQITNEAAKRLTAEGLGRFFCLAGIGGDVSGIVESTKAADNVIVLDGCGVACAKLCLEKINVPITCYIDATELGIDKQPHFDITEEQIGAVCDAVRSAVSE
ncbi:MAG: putative zinc-binding protein [Phycisphaerae bacterium]|nr:putative zinc-binding protein [Phycisphaerae bacterium]